MLYKLRTAEGHAGWAEDEALFGAAAGAGGLAPGPLLLGVGAGDGRGSASVASVDRSAASEEASRRLPHVPRD